MVSKEELLSRSDAVSIHLVLSDRTRGLIGATDIARMKPGAILVNTSRGPIVDEKALIEAVQARRIVAALDVFDQEPLPTLHPFRALSNVIATPHIGYVSRGLYQRFYQDTVDNISQWLDNQGRAARQPVSGKQYNG